MILLIRNAGLLEGLLCRRPGFKNNPERSQKIWSNNLDAVQAPVNGTIIFASELDAGVKPGTPLWCD